MAKTSYIVGIDEVGRGALAGPVVVAAVLLPLKMTPSLQKLGRPLRDSKKLNPKAREIWFDYAKKHPQINYSIRGIRPETIDAINISQAANRAASRAFDRLLKAKHLPSNRFKTYLDGGLFLNESFHTAARRARTLIRGDEKINAIKLASILAKVTRDKYMIRLHRKYPKYHFHEHKGYGTKKHIQAIKSHGPNQTHRLTFIKKYINLS